MKLREIDKLLGEITQGDWVAISLDGYPIVGVKHPPVDDSKKWQLKVISVLTTEQMKGLGKVVKIELDDEDRANLGLIAAAPTIIRELVERVEKLENGIREIDTMREMFPDDPLIIGLCDKAVGLLEKESA